MQMNGASFEWDGNGGVEIEGSDGSTVALTEDEVIEAVEFLTDGLCPLCLQEIPLESELCSECLKRVAAYHRAQFGG
jgi:hypothetical protein